MDQDTRTLFDLPHSPAAAGLRAEDYVRLLHPPGSRGKATLMQLDGKEATFTRTHDPRNLSNIVGAWLDVSGYVALNRYFGPRARNPLAALNALYVDLDFHTVDNWRGVAPEVVARAFLSCVRAKGIPVPSLVNDTGRGLAAIWLIDETHPDAFPRWKSAMSVLPDLFKSFGADRACTDAARVFRLPGTINLKCGREVRVIEGTLRRLSFDDLADCIYTAAGRPTRDQLAARRKHAVHEKMPSAPAEPATSRGLTAALRFAQIRSDLERLSEHWGGAIPEGRRNTWLHLYATCLTQEHGATDIEGKVNAVAAIATPGLKESEVSAVIKSALQRAEAAYAPNPNVDGRLNYSGATIAELLDVSDPLARQLQLRQIFSREERKRRDQERLTARRREQGVRPREEYLAKNTVSAQKPWLDQGISRSTWYRRGCPASPKVQGHDDTADSDETGLISLQGGLPLGTTKETAGGGIFGPKATRHPHPRKPQENRNRAATKKSGPVSYSAQKLTVAEGKGAKSGHLKPGHPLPCALFDAQQRMTRFQRGDLRRSS